MTRQEAYELLKRAGHSPLKAMQIALDYERGDELANQWVRGVSASKLPITLTENVQ